MIKLLDNEFIPWDIYSARVLAAYRSYCDLPECQFWGQGDVAVISLVDGFAILAAKENADWEELAAFLQMQPWGQSQCNESAAARLPFPVGWRSMTLRFVAPLGPTTSPLAPAQDPGQVYDILTRCFPDMKNRSDWMADLALRWRRGTAQSWMMDGQCTVSAMAITENYVFLGAVGTLPEARGKGLAGKLLTQVVSEMAGREAWISCREAMQGFYEGVGFERAGDMITLRREGGA